jgi:hypothetical protein
MVLHIQHFIMDEYGWKSELPPKTFSELEENLSSGLDAAVFC